MFKITVKNKLLLLLAFCCMSEAQPKSMVKCKALHKASLNFAKDAGARIYKHLYWEDVAVLSLVCGTAYLAWKHWASDATIQGRYKAEARNNAELKQKWADGEAGEITLSTHTAVHMPNFWLGFDDGLEELSYEISALRQTFSHSVERGWFWDSHACKVYIRKPAEDVPVRRKVTESQEDPQFAKALEDSKRSLEEQIKREEQDRQDAADTATTAEPDNRHPLERPYSKAAEEYNGNWQGMSL